MEWQSSSPSRVSFLRKDMDLDDFLSQTSDIRTFIGAGGIRYTWRLESKTMLLFDTKSEELVARTRWLTGTEQKPESLHLEVLAEALPSMNAIFVTFVILEQELRTGRRR